MPKIADAWVEVVARTGKYKADITNAKRITADFGRSATKSLKRVTIGLTLVAAAAAAVAVAIGIKLAKAMVRMGAAVVKTAIRFDKLKIGMIAITGSAKEAERQIERLRVLSLKPGLGFEQALQGSISLQAAGIEAAVAERSLAAFGNALAVIGKGAPELSRVNLQLSQIAAKTSGFGADLRVLREAIPAIGPALQRAFNNKPVEDITISGIELIKVLTAELEKLGQAGDSVGNNINNLKTSFTILKKTIGDVFLSITSDTAKTLTKIIDDITLIIPVWQSVQDDIAVVFQEILKLTLTATGEIMKGMFRIISAAAPLIFKPLTNSAKKFFRDFAAGFSVSVNEVMRFARVITQKQYETFLVELVNANQEANNKSAENFKKEYEAAIKSAVDVSIKELPRIGKVFGETLTQISTLIAGIAEKIPTKIAESGKKTKKAFLKAFELTDKEKKALFPGLTQEDPNKQFEQQRKAAKRIADFNKEQSDIVSKRQKANLAKFREFLRSQEKAQGKMRQKFEEITRGMRFAFSDFIAESISDINNIADAWASFVQNMKQEFIRAAADMIANKAFRSIIDVLSKVQTGGGGGAPNVSAGIKQGVGTALGAFFGNLVVPGVGAVIGGAVGGGIGANLAPASPNMTNNFFQTDFANLDQTRIQKTVSQKILPSLEEERTDGR